jgi:peptidoglycan/LPS O-acetylase OafA/YrhL
MSIDGRSTAARATPLDAPADSVAPVGPVTATATQTDPDVPITDLRPQPPPSFRLGNRPPLTGIRAFVIVSILIYHSTFATLPGAWASITVFFVLSGFLITSMLVGEHDRTDRISLTTFYTRRAVRLIPPLAITVALLGIYAAVVTVPDAPQRIWGDVSAAVFYYADVRSASGREPFFGFLSQAWSLSIEEQFYVAWSLLLVVALTIGRRWAAYLVSATGAALSAGLGFWLLLRDPQVTHATVLRVYYGFGSRADALFVGCLLGLVATGGHLDQPPAFVRRLSALLALASAGLLAWIAVNVTFGTRPSLLVWLPLTIVASVFLIAYFVSCPDGLGSKFVGLAPFVLVGNLAYTVYLVHWPVYVALSVDTVHWSFWPVEVLRLTITFAIALASWFLVERPLMRWRRRVLAEKSRSRSGTEGSTPGGPEPIPATGGD